MDLGGAALLFQESVIQAVVTIGFTSVRVAAHAFYHATCLVMANVDRDDLVAAGETHSLEMRGEGLEQLSVLKKMPRSEPPTNECRGIQVWRNEIESSG